MNSGTRSIRGDVHMTDRNYGRSLPYTIPSWELGIVVGALTQNDIWNRLPRAVAVKINDARMRGVDLIVTKADLDSLPDSVWLAISHLLPGGR